MQDILEQITEEALMRFRCDIQGWFGTGQNWNEERDVWQYHPAQIMQQAIECAMPPDAVLKELGLAYPDLTESEGYVRIYLEEPTSEVRVIEANLEILLEERLWSWYQDRHSGDKSALLRITRSSVELIDLIDVDLF